MANPEKWQTLAHTESAEMNAAASQLHHASQFVALFGNSLLPKASDDSQSNMRWLPMLKALAGQEVNLKRRIRMALLYESFELQLIDENESALGVFPLSGQTKATALSFVRAQGRQFGIRPDDIQPISHFKLPKYELDEGAPFRLTSPSHFQELARYRHNAQLLLTEIAAGFEYASPVATWPHHFDTGSVITAQFDDQGNPTKTVGIGLAIADGISDEFYFYVSPWQKNGEINWDKLPPLPAGAQWVNGQWKGAVLKLSEIVRLKSVEEQRRLTEGFLRTGIELFVAPE